MYNIGYVIELIAYFLFGLLMARSNMKITTLRFWLFMFCMALNSIGCILQR